MRLLKYVLVYALVIVLWISFEFILEAINVLHPTTKMNVPRLTFVSISLIYSIMALHYYRKP